MSEPLRIKILDLGQIDCKKMELLQTESADAMIISPMVAVLIKHPDLGYILFDTGNDPDWRNTYSESMKTTYPISRVVSIEDALKKENLTIQDINYLVISHLHFDHAGGLKFFANSKAGSRVIVSEAELNDVKEKIPGATNQESGAYMGKLFYNLPGITFEPIKERCELAKGVLLFVQKCHTAGLVGMAITLKDKNVLFTGDTVYLKDAYENELPPGGAINKTNTEFFDNLKVLKKMQKELNAEVFYGHDYEQAKAWRALGWIE